MKQSFEAAWGNILRNSKPKTIPKEKETDPKSIVKPELAEPAEPKPTEPAEPKPVKTLGTSEPSEPLAPLEPLELQPFVQLAQLAPERAPGHARGISVTVLIIVFSALLFLSVVSSLFWQYRYVRLLERMVFELTK